MNRSAVQCTPPQQIRCWRGRMPFQAGIQKVFCCSHEPALRAAGPSLRPPRSSRETARRLPLLNVWRRGAIVPYAILVYVLYSTCSNLCTVSDVDGTQGSEIPLCKRALHCSVLRSSGTCWYGFEGCTISFINRICCLRCTEGQLSLIHISEPTRPY